MKAITNPKKRAKTIKALKLVLDLAEGNVLSGHQCDTPELKREQMRQENAVRKVDLFLKKMARQ